MCNIILNSLKTTNLQAKENKSTVLKPLPVLGLSPIQTINTNDTLIQGIPGNTPLISPFSLFSNNEHSVESILGVKNLIPNPQSYYSQNTSIIEPGVTTESINALKQFPGKQWLGKLASNGNREVAILIPEGINYNKPVELIYYFHGHDGKISRCMVSETYGFKEKIKSMAKDRNAIFVIPQGPPMSGDYKWMNGKYKEDMQQFEIDTQDIIKNKLDSRVHIGSITVKAHSAGGIPVRNATGEGKLTADRIDFLDASYRTWASQSYENFMKKNPNGKFNIVYIPGAPTQAEALKLEGQKGVALIKSNVEHSAVPKNFVSI